VYWHALIALLQLSICPSFRAHTEKHYVSLTYFIGMLYDYHELNPSHRFYLIKLSSNVGLRTHFDQEIVYSQKIDNC
jgi:hypothetical protein